MKIKTKDLTGAALDWAVAKTAGYAPYFEAERMYVSQSPNAHEWCPSTNWAQGGPIIEREAILIAPPPDNAPTNERWWYAQKDRKKGPTAFWCGKGRTPLIAAMRCYVAVISDDEIEVPAELIGEA